MLNVSKPFYKSMQNKITEVATKMHDAIPKKKSEYKLMELTTMFVCKASQEVSAISQDTGFSLDDLLHTVFG